MLEQQLEKYLLVFLPQHLVLHAAAGHGLPNKATCQHVSRRCNE